MAAYFDFFVVSAFMFLLKLIFFSGYVTTKTWMQSDAGME